MNFWKFLGDFRETLWYFFIVWAILLVHNAVIMQYHCFSDWRFHLLCSISEEIDLWIWLTCLWRILHSYLFIEIELCLVAIIGGRLMMLIRIYIFMITWRNILLGWIGTIVVWESLLLFRKFHGKWFDKSEGWIFIINNAFLNGYQVVI